jgi:hypothetical protein
MRLVYKETNSGGGEGFRLLEYAGGRYCINRIACKEEDILSLLSKSNYLIEEYCCQGAFEQRLWPYSVNTIRIITLLFHGDIQVAAALQRIGIDKEKCVDNACAGGLYSSINLETGELSAARSHSPENLLEHDGTPKWFSNHPGTQAQIEGALIPEWTTLCNDIVNLHKKLAFTEIEFIAWDIALLDDGYKIIEANTSCGMYFLQTFKGARNEMIGKWMKEKGYIK